MPVDNKEEGITLPEEFDGKAYGARVAARMAAFSYAKERPTLSRDGTKQAAPEPFARWLQPGIWEDAAGDAHLDVLKMMELFELPNTERNRQETVNYLLRTLEAARPRGHKATVVVRTDEDVEGMEIKP